MSSEPGTGSSVPEEAGGTVSLSADDSVTKGSSDDGKSHGDSTTATSDLDTHGTQATSDLPGDVTKVTSDLQCDVKEVASGLGQDGTLTTSDSQADGSQAICDQGGDLTKSTSDSGGDVCIDLTLDSSPMASVMSEVSMDSSGLEEPLTPATDNSEKSGSVSGRITPGSQSDQSATFSSSEKSTPRKRQQQSVECTADVDNLSSSSGSVKSFGSKLPQRIGINWRNGERLEAMDFMHKWFPAKIRDINRQDLQVLIHFDGWNQRFDEWVDMTSDRIRPLIRHSGRKDRGQMLLKREYRIGEQVYAKWTDCKMYPAKIIGHLQNGSYEVIFYDGFKKQVQPINVRPVPGEAKRKIIEVSPPPVEPVKKIKMKGYNIDVVTSDTPIRPQLSSKSKGEHRKRQSSDSESGRPAAKQKKTKRLSHPKLVPVPLKADGTEPGIALTKSEPVSTQTEYSESVETKPETLPRVTSPGPSSLHGLESSMGLSSGPRMGHDSGGSSIIPGVGATSDCFITHTSSATKYQEVARPYVPPVIPRKAFVVESDHNRYKCQYEACNKGFRKEHLLEYHIKYYHMDNGGSTPTTPQPAKKRRKTICIGSPESPAHSGKKSSQKKNRHVSESSMVTDIKQEVKEEPVDSHVLQPGIIVKQETGEISTQTTPVKYADDHSLIDDVSVKQEVKLEGKHHRTSSQDSYFTEESSVTDAEEFLKPDELVNCICDFYEENGLMIQCEVCMCWQHASCFGITDRTLPKTYVCFVCENPPGVRDSSRYIHEQDWLKTGEMASFSYLDILPESSGRCTQIKATHCLITDLQRLNTVLDSLKLQLNVLRTKDVEKMKMWRVDWDLLMQESKSSVEEDGNQAMGEHSDNTEITDTVVKQELDDCATKTEATEQISTDGSIANRDNPETDAPEGEVTNDATDPHVVGEIGASSDGKDKDVDDDSGNKENAGGLDEAGQGDDFELKLELTDDEEDKVMSASKVTETDHDTGKVGPGDGTKGEPHQSNEDAPNEREKQSGEASRENVSADVKSSGGNTQQDITPSGSMESMDVEGKQYMNGEASGMMVHQSDRGEALTVKEAVSKEEGAEIKEEGVEIKVEVEEGSYSDSTESAAEDPIEFCERNLLNHILRVQAAISERFDLLEEQITHLEALEASNTGRAPPSATTVLSDVPQLKRTSRAMEGDLGKVRKMSVFH